MMSNIFYKMGRPRPLFNLFSSFQTNITILQQINVKKCPSSIQCWDSNPRPLEHESPPITTRPGLLPYDAKHLWSNPGYAKHLHKYCWIPSNVQLL